MPGGFNHYEQSLRVVDVLENDGRGLNLTWEVRDGIAKHSKGKRGAPVGADPSRRASDARGPDRARRRPHRLRQPRHRRCDSRRAAEASPDLPRARRGASLGHSSSERIGRMVADVVHDDAARRARRDSDGAGRARSDAGAPRVPLRARSTRTRSRRPSSRRPRHPRRPVGEGRRAARRVPRSPHAGDTRARTPPFAISSPA